MKQQQHQLLTEEAKKRLMTAIEGAELNTSGEIRIHIERKCSKEPLERAAEVFAILKMHKTQQRNGILFYVAFEDKKFAILGDAGINELVKSDFWDEIKEQMTNSFKSENFIGGIEDGVRQAGEQLKKFFPYQNNDRNELSDEISYG